MQLPIKGHTIYTVCILVVCMLVMQAYARKLGDCLMEVTRAGTGGNSPALRQLRTWTSECSSLRVFMVCQTGVALQAIVVLACMLPQQAQ